MILFQSKIQVIILKNFQLMQNLQKQCLQKKKKKELYKGCLKVNLNRLFIVQIKTNNFNLQQVGNEMLKPSYKRNLKNLDLEDSSLDNTSKMPVNLAKSRKISQNNTALQSPMDKDIPSINKLVMYKQIEGKTFAYENYVKKLENIKKKDSVEYNKFSQTQHLYDNFINEKIERTHPIIIGLSSNYKINSPNTKQTSDSDYKRHKIKKSQYLVRTAIKYLENQREHENLSNYDKSFQRLKQNALQVKQNSQINENPSFTKGELEILKRYKEKNLKQTAEEQRQQKKRIQKNFKKQRSMSSSENPNSNGSDSESDTSVNSEQRRFMEKQNDVNKKIMDEIVNLKEKISKKAIQRKYFSQSKAQHLIKYQQILDWAKIHNKEKLQSVQKFEKKLVQIKTNSSPIKENGENSFENDQQSQFKSQEIMKRVLDLEKNKQSNKIRSQIVKAKNKISYFLNFKPLNKLNNQLTPTKNEVNQFYDIQTFTPINQQQRRSTFSRSKAVSDGSDQEQDKGGFSYHIDFKHRTNNHSPKQQNQVDSNTFLTPSNRKKSTSLSKQEEKNALKIQNNIDYQKIFINGLEDVINDIHKGNYL
ncbi:hypothetical protein TTHERM_00268150 (macronuclear) [Tetrahymena thermophila SB210]|uniref:Uncharacterized protein n=1 Tax=Tetrahymena thermophila (strain SB210) TaxID=312017 RepID=I7ME86_TETTS|nr:hypothetical protein TTHERM_00268150 [Tetrahymena thermophila SB210]EAR95705.2 hypothetical protein TTHERM_00268150 [Tetrahymena thermophila SB210]|eukprot:XP_001015950.2 hypothetical protein TTHERM_00268150 [Tetrahymena thermophila SB210]